MRALGIILAGGSNERLGKLTSARAIAAMPVGSQYRAIDFSLSSMTNSGIRKVAVMTQYNSSSLHNHVSSAKWWDLGRKKGGLFIFSPYLANENSSWFKGTADAMYQNMKFFTRSNEEYVVIASGNTIYKIDFEDVVDQHIAKESDITVVYKEIFDQDVRKLGVMELDEHENLINFEEKPLETNLKTVSLGMYVIKRELLIDLLTQINSEGRHDFVRDIIIRYRKVLNIRGFKFDGYWSTLNNTESYYNANMDFLKKETRDFFTKEYPYISTKPRDEPPAKYNSGAEVKDSLVGSGAIINGYVESSVLFTNVYVGENTSIKNSIIMHKTHIGNNCVIENAILDKETVVLDGQRIVGKQGEPIMMAKGVTL